MASARMIAATLWAAPVAAVTAMAVWALYDFLGIPNPTFFGDFVLALLVGLILMALGLRLSQTYLRRLGLLVVAGSYFLAHAVALPADPAAAIGFMTLALVAVELRILAARFAPMYGLQLGEEDRERLDDALGRTVLRISVVSATAFLATLLTADIALAGTLPVTSVPTALVLAAALIGVVFLLAAWPFLGLPERRPPTANAPIQTPK